MQNGFYESDADRAEYSYFKESKNNCTFAHFHKSCEILVVKSGEIVVRGNGEEKTLHRGDVFFADRYVTHLYRSCGETLAYIWVFSDYFMNDFRTVYKNALPAFMPVGNGNEPLVDFADRVYPQWEDFGPLMRKGVADWVLGYLAQRYPPVEGKSGADGFFFSRVLQYIEDRFREDLTVQSVADAFGYTPNYFSSLFYKYTAVHFRDYLNRFRLLETKKLRSSAGMSISEAAQSCGFLSMNTYYRALARWNEKDAD